MRRHRIITATVATVAVLCLQVTSAGASSTLLSGYGGPGQGNQAIIGATLIGGGGGSGGSAGSESSSSTATSSAPASIALARAPRKATARSRSPHRGAGRAGSATAPAETTGSGGAPRTVAPAAARSAGGALGLSGADFLYVILAACVLAGTAFLTVRLTGRPDRARGAE